MRCDTPNINLHNHSKSQRLAQANTGAVGPGHDAIYNRNASHGYVASWQGK